MDPNEFLEQFVTGNASNDPKHENPAYDRLIENAAQQTGAARMETFRQAEEMFINTDTVIAPFFHYVKNNLIDAEVWEGWNTNILDIHPYVGLKKKN